MVILHLHILCVLLLLKLTIPASTAKSAYLYFSMHKSVQVHLLYYVVGAECISLYLGPTKIQQSRLVEFIALWIPCNPGLVAPSMHATSAPTTVCTLAWLVDFIIFFGCGTHNSWSSCIYTFYVFCCCWSWQYLHRPQNLQTSTFQCISLFKFIYFIMLWVLNA